MNILSYYFKAISLTFLTVAIATAQDNIKQDATTLNSSEFKTYAEFRQYNQRVNKDFTQRYRKANAKEKSKVAATRPTILAHHPFLSKLVADGTAEEAEEIISWWWHGSRGRRDGEIMAKLLIDHHIQSKIMEKYVPRIRWDIQPKKAIPLLRTIHTDSNLKSVKATSAFSLLELLIKIEETDSNLPETLKAEIESLSTSLKTDYAKFTDSVDVPFGERIEALEFSRQLVVGNSVPDIVGTDLDGIDFKLSDYKDKVVMISFWGQW